MRMRTSSARRPAGEVLAGAAGAGAVTTLALSERDAAGEPARTSGRGS